MQNSLPGAARWCPLKLVQLFFFTVTLWGWKCALDFCTHAKPVRVALALGLYKETDFGSHLLVFCAISSSKPRVRASLVYFEFHVQNAIDAAYKTSASFSTLKFRGLKPRVNAANLRYLQKCNNRQCCLLLAAIY